MQPTNKPSSWLQQQALLHPERPAFLWKKESWSFSLLAQLAQRYAAYYGAHIPQNTKRVALYSKNSPECYFSIIGLWELGIEVQLLNRRLTEQEWLFQMADAQTTFLISDEPIAVPDFMQQLTIPKTLPAVPETHYIDKGYQEQAVASIMYTSGTTGRPKGVPQSFANHQASALATQQSMHLTQADCWGLVLPLFHISGLSILLRSLRLGLAVYLYDGFDPIAIEESLQAKQVTVLSLVTSALQQLLPYLSATGYPQLKTLLLGGGPITQPVVQQALAKNIPIMPSFGMTETCSQIVAVPTDEVANKIGAAGYPLHDVAIKIGDPKMAPGEVGEIFIQGPSVIQSYLNHSQTSAWTQDGWFNTGDLGYLDGDGALYVKSRLSELIISGGENIYPSEVEQVLLQHPSIQEAAVVGREDVRWGQVPTAYIQVSSQVTLAMLQSYLQQSLATYKQPKEIYVVHALPKTASGKVLKRLLLTEERVKYIDYPLGT